MKTVNGLLPGLLVGQVVITDDVYYGADLGKTLEEYTLGHNVKISVSHTMNASIYCQWK